MGDFGNVVVGVDIGTFEAKAVAVAADGRVVADASRPHEPEAPHDGWLEHDAHDVWWRGLVETITSLLGQGALDASDVVGVSCSGIGPCVLPVDESLESLRPAILYGVDGRATGQITALNERLGRDQIFSRCGNTLSTQSAGPKVLWLRDVEPDTHGRAAHFLTCQSYLVARLTGALVIDHTTASYWHPLYNHSSQRWDTTHCEDFVRPDQLSAIRWPAEVAGWVTEDASRSTGLAVGTPVAVGTADAPAEALACGVLDSGDMMVMYGSSSFMIQASDQPTTSETLWNAPYLFPGTWQCAGGTASAGAMTRWVIELLGLENPQLNAVAFEALVDLAKESPPGANGLILLPYIHGERTPLHDSRIRGMFAGMSATHNRADFARAAIEGVAHAMAAAIASFETTGRPPARVNAVGGGVANPIWLQAVSDITGLTQYVGGRAGAAYGSAVLAALATNVLPTQSDVSRWLRHPNTSVVPRDEHVQRYADAHASFLDLTHYARTYSTTSEAPS